MEQKMSIGLSTIDMQAKRWIAMASLRRFGLVCAFASLAVGTGSVMATPSMAGCKEDVAKAFEEQRKKANYRMKTRQISERGLIFLTVDYALPYKMHQIVKSATSSNSSELILIGTRSWQSSGLGWTLMRAEETKALNEQFGAAVLSPPEDKLKYECLGRVDVDGRSLVAYQGKQGSSGNVRTDTAVLRTVYVDPDTGLPVRAEVARATKPDLAFFKADYSYPDDINIEPPKDAKTAPRRPSDGEEAPQQSTTP